MHKRELLNMAIVIATIILFLYSVIDTPTKLQVNTNNNVSTKQGITTITPIQNPRDFDISERSN